MTWTSVFTGEIWPMAVTIFLMLLLAGYSWRRWSVPGALPFIAGYLFTTLIIVGSLMTFPIVDPADKIF